MRRRERRIAWALFTLWCAWAYASTGFLGAVTPLGAWLPDLGLVLLLALGVHVAPGRLAWAALIVALARIAFSVDPPVAVLAGYLGFAGLQAVLRSFVNLEDPFARGALAGFAALLLDVWWSWVHAIRNPVLLDAPGTELAWRAALATAACALLFSELLLRLPGLRPLRRQHFLGGRG